MRATTRTTPGWKRRLLPVALVSACLLFLAAAGAVSLHYRSEEAEGQARYTSLEQRYAAGDANYSQVLSDLKHQEYLQTQSEEEISRLVQEAQAASEELSRLRAENQQLLGEREALRASR